MSLPATVTAVKCSAALPNRGSSITPMNRCDSPTSLAACSSECTRISAIQETNSVATTRRTTASRLVILGSSSWVPSVANRSECVPNWNTRNRPYIPRRITAAALDRLAPPSVPSSSPTVMWYTVGTTRVMTASSRSELLATNCVSLNVWTL